MQIDYLNKTGLDTLVAKLKSIFANKAELDDVKKLASNPVIKEVNKNNNENIWVGTKAEFDAITEKNDLITYIVKDDNTDTGYATIEEFNRLMQTESEHLEDTIEDKTAIQMSDYKTNTLDPFVETTKSEMTALKNSCETAVDTCVTMRTQIGTVRDEVNKTKTDINNMVLIQQINVNGSSVNIVDKTANLTIPVIHTSTNEPTTSDGNDGDIWIIYE